MRKYNTNDGFKGWFAGDFESAFRTKKFEAALKCYKEGESEARHVHKIATELTLAVSGSIQMNDMIVKQGEVVVLEPGEPCAFTALTDAWTVVIKTPSVLGDKYLVS